MNGPVAFPGAYPLTEGMTVADLIGVAGGKRDAINYTAELAHFEIRNHDARVVRVDTLRLDDAGQLQGALAAHDVLTVRPVEHANTKEWMINIGGAVRFPGTYVLKERETLVQVLQRAGGFAADANPEGLALLREEARRNEQAQLDLMVDRLSHELALKSIESTSASATAGGKDEQHADAGFFDFGKIMFDQRKQGCSAKRAGDGNELHQQRLFCYIQQPGNDDAQPGNLRDGEIGKNHTSLQNLHAKRYVRGKHQQARDECGQQDIEFDGVHFNPANSRAMVSSNSVNKSVACLVPPTV